MSIFLQTPKKQGVLQKSSFHPVSGNQAGHPKVPAKGRIPERRFLEIHFLCRRLLFFAERHGFHIPLQAVQGMRNNIRPLRGLKIGAPEGKQKNLKNFKKGLAFFWSLW